MTVTYTPAQIGYETGAGWNVGPPMFVGGATIAGALQFTLPAAPETLTFRTLTLQLRWAVGVETGTLTIALVNDSDEAVFGAGNLPSDQALIPLYSGLVAFDGVTLDYTFPLSLGVDPLDGTVGGFGPTAMQVLRHSDFQGNAALVLDFTGGLVRFTPTENQILTGDEAPFLTGIPTTKDRLSRADWCPRCGQPIFREKLLKDGYTKMLVCPDCYDPPERRQRRFIPPKEVNP